MYIYTHTYASVAATLRLRLLPTKMAVTLLFVFFTVAGLAVGRNINLQNNLGYPVWVGTQGSPGKGQPYNGGFALNPGEILSKWLENWGCGNLCAHAKNFH